MILEGSGISLNAHLLAIAIISTTSRRRGLHEPPKNSRLEFHVRSALTVNDRDGPRLAVDVPQTLASFLGRRRELEKTTARVWLSWRSCF